jgi:hypothetical protein
MYIGEGAMEFREYRPTYSLCFRGYPVNYPLHSMFLLHFRPIVLFATTLQTVIIELPVLYHSPFEASSMPSSLQRFATYCQCRV